MARYLTFLFVAIFCNLNAQVTLSADGPGDTYDLITSVLAPGANPIEVPDCNHTDFGEHIDEVFDAELNANVFRFFMHVDHDDDRCIVFDRQRAEIKTYDQSPDHLKGVEDEVVEYKWKFKLDAGFQSSPKFTHIHQLKAVGGPESSQPVIALTTRKGSPDELELRYAESTSAVTLIETDLAPFLGVWCEATENVTYGENGSYAITIKKVADQSTLLTYSDNDIRMWRTDAEFVRPKWGIYRSLLFEEDLRDEEVLFNDFSIEEIEEPLPVELISFSARLVDNKKAVLDWQTASEDNNKGFEIERSNDGQKWELLDFVNGQGSSNTKNDYQYIDKTMAIGPNYYRLKQIDFDESVEYSETAVVLVEEPNDKFHIFPNPSSGMVHLKGLRQDVLVKVYDKTGFIMEAQSENTELDLRKLPTGSYFLSFYVDQEHITQRLIKL